MISITAVNTTYFHLAAKYYGDATQALSLMLYNGVEDPIILGRTGVSIPDVSAPSNNGLHPLAVDQVVTLPASSATTVTGNS